MGLPQSPKSPVDKTHVCLLDSFVDAHLNLKLFCSLCPLSVFSSQLAIVLRQPLTNLQYNREKTDIFARIGFTESETPLNQIFGCINLQGLKQTYSHLAKFKFYHLETFGSNIINWFCSARLGCRKKNQRLSHRCDL